MPPAESFLAPSGTYELAVVRTTASATAPVRGGRSAAVASGGKGPQLSLIAFPTAKRPEKMIAYLLNSGSALLMFDMMKDEQLAVNVFPAEPSCHDFNYATSGGRRLDLAVGLTSGEVVLLDPYHKKVAMRLNADGGEATASAVTSLRWADKETVVVGHASGELFVYTISGATDADPWHLPASAGAINHLCFAPPATPSTVLDADSDEDAPRRQTLAVVTQDGVLRVFDFASRRLLYASRSYFGGLTCVTWSPCGHYILTGGEDDLVSVFSHVNRGALVARGQGHQSWVSAVAFDPWNCTPTAGMGTYSFASVGHDGRLLLWELDLSSLFGPRLRRASTIDGDEDDANQVADEHVRLALAGEQWDAAPRDAVPLLTPTSSHRASDVLTALAFLKDAVLTCDCNGAVATWARPARRSKFPARHDGDVPVTTTRELLGKDGPLPPIEKRAKNRSNKD